MKTIVLISVMTFTRVLLSAQTVSSSCSAPDSIASKYLKDAHRLTLNRIQSKGFTYKDSAHIPKQYSDTSLRALLAVYNATTIPECDTVTKIFEIHTFPTLQMNSFSFDADSSLPWIKDLMQRNLNTSEPVFNTIMSTYNFSLVSATRYLWASYTTVKLISDSDYNLPVIMKQISALTGVIRTYTGTIMGGGNSITQTVYNDHVQLIYSYGWGDCPSGCISRRYWVFNVYYDCSVQFVESYGDVIPVSTFAVSSVSLNKTSLDTTVLGQTIQLSATVLPSYASDKLVNWSTSDSSIATVNATGLVTPVGIGTVTITVKSVDGSHTAKCPIKVESVTNSTIESSDAITISPNPFVTIIQITGELTDYHFEIFNCLGHKLMEGQSVNNTISNVNKLPSGLYFIRVSSEKQSKTCKIIKK